MCQAFTHPTAQSHGNIPWYTVPKPPLASLLNSCRWSSCSSACRAPCISFTAAATLPCTVFTFTFEFASLSINTCVPTGDIAGGDNPATLPVATPERSVSTTADDEATEFSVLPEWYPKPRPVGVDWGNDRGVLVAPPSVAADLM